MKYAAYSEYKSSLTHWLPIVPTHWNSNRLRHLLSERLQYGANESAELDDPELPRYVRITDIDENDCLRDETFRSLPEETARPYLLKDGDVLFARSGATSGKTFLYRNTWGRCAYAGYLIRARLDQKKLLPSFLRYFTASSNYWQWLSSSYIQATIQNVSAEKYADLWLPVPPIEEQDSIARFLDAKTAQIDALVAQKRQLIDKLKEKRSALIARTVTRGLPPEAAKAAGLEPAPAMKNSGVEWLDAIPAHWELKPLKRRCFVIDCKHLTAEFTDEGFPLASIREVQSRYVNLSDAKQTSNDYYVELIGGGRKPAPGDLIFSRNATVGEVAQVTALLPPFAMGQDVCLIRKHREDISSDFLQIILKSSVCISQIENLMVGSTFKRVNVDGIRNLLVPFPPIAEQNAIAAFLESETSRIDRLISLAENATARLTEYRQALITSAVTGKIDVRAFRHARAVGHPVAEAADA